MSSRSSSTSSSSSSDVDDDFVQAGIAAVLDVANHFQFDPLASSSSGSEANTDSETSSASSNEDEFNEDPRIGNVEWCQCGRCTAMDNGLESVCCREIGRVDALRGDGNDCITMHETFTGACLNIHALQIAYYALIEDHPALVEAPEIHRRYRYTAYRMFARWVWRRLGATGWCCPAVSSRP
ncbi:hypothetical protein HPB50_027951 [Hyalomma asiaticum]|nr:hypothetical protein HPB50_027951 [Hyalomma asiaticum]